MCVATRVLRVSSRAREPVGKRSTSWRMGPLRDCVFSAFNLSLPGTRIIRIQVSNLNTI